VVSEIQTHGFEKEENEHDVVDKVYLDINPRPQQSEVVQSLKNQAGEEWKARCTEHYAWKAAEYIIELENALEKEKEIQDHMWKSISRIEQQRDEADNTNKFLRKLINKYHLENDAFTGKGNIND